MDANQRLKWIYCFSGGFKHLRGMKGVFFCDILVIYIFWVTCLFFYKHRDFRSEARIGLFSNQFFKVPFHPDPQLCASNASIDISFLLKRFASSDDKSIDFSKISPPNLSLDMLIRIMLIKRKTCIKIFSSVKFDSQQIWNRSIRNLIITCLTGQWRNRPLRLKNTLK